MNFRILTIIFVFFSFFSCNNNKIETLKKQNDSLENIIISKKQEISNFLQKNCIAVYPRYSHIVYVGSENCLNIECEGYNTDSLIIEANNSKILQTNGNYYLIPQKTGELNLKVYILNNKDKILLYTRKLYSEYYNYNSFCLNLIENDTISKNSFKHFTLAKFGNYTGQYPNINSKLLSFNLVAYKNGKRIEALSDSNFFSEKQKELVNNLSTGDYIYIEDIMIKNYDKIEKLNVLKFYLK